jgi:uncharacterized damage-inducible protein DinB
MPLQPHRPPSFYPFSPETFLLTEKPTTLNNHSSKKRILPILKSQKSRFRKKSTKSAKSKKSTVPVDIGLSLPRRYFTSENKNTTLMDTLKSLLEEMEQEAQTTEKMLSRIPDDKYQWKPHAKSMTIEQLSTHIAELPTWVTITLNTDELDFATVPYEPKKVSGTADLLKLFEDSLADGYSSLQKADISTFDKTWTLRNGEQILNQRTKAEVIRMTYCQIVHHRAQLGVYLRLLDIPIPGSYGPSADEQGF